MVVNTFKTFGQGTLTLEDENNKLTISNKEYITLIPYKEVRCDLCIVVINIKRFVKVELKPGKLS